LELTIDFPSKKQIKLRVKHYKIIQSDTL